MMLGRSLNEIKETQKELVGMYSLNEKITIHSDLEEVKLELGQLKEIKDEIAALKGLVVKEIPKGKTKRKRTSYNKIIVDGK